jgi:mono/diheme cytochrome c family protein
MRRLFVFALVLLAAGTSGLLLLAFWPLPPQRAAAEFTGDIKRGAYLARLSGCVSCHTTAEGDPLAGGVGLKSPFGTFYSPNITPDRLNGIGSWNYSQFVAAVRHGVSPEEESYYPAFPYEFYASFSDSDLADLWAALRSLPPSPTPSREHEVGFPFNIRAGLKPWRTFFERSHAYIPDKSQTTSWNRGKFIVEGPAHCAACHTPRNLFGGLETNAGMSGNAAMLDGSSVPSLELADLLERGWTREALRNALRTGVLPDGDALGGSMAEVVHGGTSFLLTEHIDDIVSYLFDPPE